MNHKEFLELLQDGNVEYLDEYCMIHGFDHEGRVELFIEFMVKDLDTGRIFSAACHGIIDEDASITEMEHKGGAYCTKA